MLGCDHCQEWYHYDCIGLHAPGDDEDDEDVAPEDFRCPRCCLQVRLQCKFSYSPCFPRHPALVGLRTELSCCRPAYLMPSRASCLAGRFRHWGWLGPLQSRSLFERPPACMSCWHPCSHRPTVRHLLHFPP